MAADLAGRPHSGLDVQLCGDAHLSDFGLPAAPDRSVIFDVNDFDETNAGQFEWDVHGTGYLLRAGRAGQRAFTEGRAGRRLGGRLPPGHFAGRREIEIWYDRIDVGGQVAAVRDLPSGRGESGAKRKAKAEASIRKAAAKGRLRDA